MGLVCVDHGLRAGSATDLAFVRGLALRLGLPFWSASLGDASGREEGLQAWARAQRYAQMSALAAALGVDTLLLAHHLEDLMETQLSRLVSGRGLRAQAVMLEQPRGASLRRWRPLLEVPSADLRAVLAAHRQVWREDPSNQLATFERVRLRKTMHSFDEKDLARWRRCASATRWEAQSLKGLVASIAPSLLSEDACAANTLDLNQALGSEAVGQASELGLWLLVSWLEKKLSQPLGLGLCRELDGAFASVGVSLRVGGTKLLTQASPGCWHLIEDARLARRSDEATIPHGSSGGTRGMSAST